MIKANLNLIRKCHNEQCGGMVYCVPRGVVDAEGVADAELVDDAEGWEANRSCWLK